MQKDSFRKDTVVKKGPPKCLSGQETANNLSKLVINREGNGYEGYGEEHNWFFDSIHDAHFLCLLSFSSWLDTSFDRRGHHR
jgi:hypothetical protein